MTTTPKTILFLCLSIISANWCQGQAGKVDATRESNWSSQVKIIDEFIDRFNGKPSKDLLAKNQTAGNRKKLVRSLFDSVASRRQPISDKFINQVTDSRHPQTLSFYDTDWYAELNFSFLNNGQKIYIPLVLQVSSADSVKWIIVGVGDHAIFRGEMKPASHPPKLADITRHSISSQSYARDFRDVCDVLRPGFNPQDFFHPEVIVSDKGNRFIQMLQNGQLNIQGNLGETMKFHFYQIPGFSFVVKQFMPNTTHSSWLISWLAAADDSQKKKSKESLLRRPL